MISVLVLVRDSRPSIVRSLEAITGQAADQDIEILVIDLTGGVAESDLSSFNATRLLHCPGLRSAVARNIAISEAKGDILCFTDADCQPRPDWVAKLIVPFADSDVAGVKGTYSNTGSRPISRFVQLEHQTKYDRLQDQTAIDFIDMYSAAYRRQVLLVNDGFDERFDRLEEQELAYRLAARGYRMVFRRDAMVRHRHISDIAGYARRKATIGYWKAQVIRLFPDRGLSDSYTPQSLRWQLGALFLGGLSLALLALNPAFLLGVLAALFIFVLSALPLMGQLWSKDRSIVLLGLPMLAVRALALVAGYSWGILRPPHQFVGQTDPISGATYMAKRLLDIFGAAVGLVVTLVLVPILALIIRADSSGPVFFRQVRIGRGGRPFTLYKFRTMEPGAEARLGEVLDLGELDQPAFKLVNDPRITRTGRFLRRWSLDELPQFWNVLRSEMSLVGPRPEEEQIVAMYSDWHRQRLAVKPGMTGPMQVHGRGDLPLDERVKLEIDYIQEYTLWRDVKILINTIPTVLKGEGAR